MIRLTKNLIKRLLKNIGYDIVNRKLLGNNIEQDILTLLPENEEITVFDIGANIGEASLEFESLFKRSKIFSFEPDTATYIKLNERVKEYKNIKTYNLGFGDANQTKELNINKGTGGNSFLDVSAKIAEYAQGDWTENVGKATAQVRTLDSFCDENDIKKLDLVKIDTQGYEMSILRGSCNSINSKFTKLIHIEVLFVELYKDQCFFQDVYTELVKRGFRLLGLYNKFYKAEFPYYLLWCDALFVSEDYNISL
jgi:FkbM family methyltransferase